MNLLAWIDYEEPPMAAAIRAAHETFDEFCRHVELQNFRVVPAFNSILVKVRVDSQFGHEHLFLSDPAISTDSIRGELASKPQRLTFLAVGEPISVHRSRLTDWFLAANERGIGGFTVEVLKSQIPPDQLDEYTAHPPVSWYNHRTVSAITEIQSIPNCSRCGEKEIIAPSFFVDGVCGLCVNNATRTNCPRCGVPLVRHQGAPLECYRCLTACHT